MRKKAQNFYSVTLLYCSAAGSVPQTAHWQLTTEPAFVTRNKPVASTTWSNKPNHNKPHSWSADSQRPSYKPENHEVMFCFAK